MAQTNTNTRITGTLPPVSRRTRASGQPEQAGPWSLRFLQSALLFLQLPFEFFGQRSWLSLRQQRTFCAAARRCLLCLGGFLRLLWRNGPA